MQRLTVKSLACFALFAASATPALAGNWCGAGKPVKFAGITWESGQFYTEVIRQVVQKGFGCQTEVVTGSTAATETALVAGDLQLWTEQWNRTDTIKKGVEAGKIKLVGDLLQGGAYEGFFVPDYVIKGDAKRGIKPLAPGLHSVSDLPKYKDLFKDEEDPGKGRFLNCPTGWDCERINTQKLKAYKLSDSYTNFRAGTGSAMDAAISSAYTRGKPVLFYYWAPATLMGRYKFIQLKEPAYNAQCWQTLQANKGETPCPSATPATKLQVGVSSAFHQAEPAVISFIEKMKLPPELLNRTIAQMQERKASPEVVAKEFLKQHPDLWKSWVSADVAAKVQKGL
ncbi:ABC transporter substrate-binding protein [Pseudogulbenkiania sp. MAI-1]|uniref:ABC transporter substrate-binding protein n=1 Tax=Pseudogulbenkiania sp. MAI-1 TaxID=990370 RepID=UPI00045E9342|nr:ABC transporter substrate-binding protein [Pseudogulbenkiania sp. MAI-1]